MNADNDSRWWDAVQVAAFLQVRVIDLPRLLGRRRIPRPSYHLGYASPRWDRGEVVALRKQGRIRI